MILFKCVCCGETVRAEAMTKAWFELVTQGRKPKPKKKIDHTYGYKVTHKDGKVKWINSANLRDILEDKKSEI